ncbi:hypothetical protein GCM10009000_061330 [Halobacterium noricense]|uniref:Transcriptional regulator n=1 Tax=Haladaptatus pallidirubidus TaxID=1008152 RepID=A0AAV3UJ60_9EURY
MIRHATLKESENDNQKQSTHDIPVDALLKVLADPCRRTVLSYLRTKDTGVATLDELSWPSMFRSTWTPSRRSNTHGLR